MNSNGIDDWALHAYIDNELSPEQRAEVEALLARDPAAAQRAGSWAQQRKLLKAAYSGVIAEEVPQHLTMALRRNLENSKSPLFSMAAAIMLVLLGGLGGWFLNTASISRTPALAEELLAAHGLYATDLRHPVDVAGGDRVYLQSWLTRRSGVSFVIPELAAQGYTLLGGRLLPGQEAAAAMLIYEAGNGQRISVLLTSSVGSDYSGITLHPRGVLTVCTWQDGKISVAVAGEMAADAMMRLAQAIYKQLDGLPMG